MPRRPEDLPISTTTPPERLTWAQARRIALRSQGIGRPRGLDVPDLRRSREALRRTVATTHLLQIDSVSVFARAHHMPVFTRTGPWDARALARASAPGPHRLLTESLAHEAALVPPQVHDLLAFRRARTATRDWGHVRRASQADPDVLTKIERLIREDGPLTAVEVSRRLGDRDRPTGSWGWSRTNTQWIVEYLFRSGRLDCVGRSPSFERRYIPAPVPPDSDAGGSVAEASAVRHLVRRAAAALGVATPASIADYFRLGRRACEAAITDLLRAGELREVEVTRPGGSMPMLLWHDAPGTAPLRAAALVSPFDPIAFHRPRLSALFDVEYRIGIYTPRERRTHGYYPLPFLLGDRFEARVDLRADRSRGVLEVCEVHREPLPDLGRTVRVADDAGIAGALAEELVRAARWQGLAAIEVLGRGDLAPALADAVRGLDPGSAEPAGPIGRGDHADRPSASPRPESAL